MSRDRLGLRQEAEPLSELRDWDQARHGQQEVVKREHSDGRDPNDQAVHSVTLV
jgi:hypothetical protein